MRLAHVLYVVVVVCLALDHSLERLLTGLVDPLPGLVTHELLILHARELGRRDLTSEHPTTELLVVRVLQSVLQRPKTLLVGLGRNVSSGTRIKNRVLKKELCFQID